MGSYIFIIKSTSLFRYKTPPTEQQTVPLGESTIKSIGDLKTVSKAIKFPVVSDTVKAATDVVTQISENTHVETARQYLQDGIKTLSETETFNNIQGKVKELNENPRVQEVITNINLKDKVDRLDTFAADGIESLASAVPALRAPTPQLVETAKDTANSYLYLATEYLASFSVAQISLRIAEKTLSLAEGTTDILKSDTWGLLASTSTKIKQVRRAIRAVKRAGERKSILEKDPVARTGIVGSIASLLHVNTILSYLGLRLEAKQEDSEDSEIIEPMEVDEAEDLEAPMDHVEEIEVEVPEDVSAVEEPAVEASKTEEEAEVEETADDGDDNHRHIADLKGDLEGYKSEEDPDYDPARDEDVEAEDEQADKELSEEETEVSEDEKEDNEVVVGKTNTTDDEVVTVDEIKENVSLEEIKDKDVSLEEIKDKDVSLEEIKDKAVSEDEKEKVSEDELKDNDVSDDEAIIEEAVEIEEDVIVEEDKLVEVTEDIEDSDEEESPRTRSGANPLLLL